MRHPRHKPPVKAFGLTRFAAGRGGNVTILTALLMPVMVAATLGGLSVTFALSRKQELTDIAQLACNRSLKPTRMKILSDADRATAATQNFDSIAAQRKLHVISRTVTAGWLTAGVKASALIPAIANMSSSDVPSYTVSVDVSCQGLPPFPKIGDAILSSNFAKPDGAPLPIWGTWGVYQPTDFGWEGGSGPGVEIQDWTSGWYGALPPGSTNPYVVELDSWSNSSMYRTVELHQGTYRFSFWYLGRVDDPATNTVSVYLEGIRPVSPSVRKLTVSRPRADGWVYEQFEIPVSTYSLYRLTIAAEGASDGVGGNFNELRLTYIKRPGQ